MCAGQNKDHSSTECLFCLVCSPVCMCVCVQADGGSNAENLAPNVVLSSLFTSSYVCVPDYLTSLYVSVCRPMEAAMQRI